MFKGGAPARRTTTPIRGTASTASSIASTRRSWPRPCTAARWSAAVAVLVMLSVIPLYGMVRQDFLPSGADEAQFEMSVAAPEGASVAAMDDVDATPSRPS